MRLSPFTTISLRRCHTAVTSATNHSQFCRDLVRRHDYEGYIATLFAPKVARDHIMASRALNVELSLLRNRIERYSGSADIFRLDFWQEAIDVMCGVKKGPKPRQPAIQALAQFYVDADQPPPVRGPITVDPTTPLGALDPNVERHKYLSQLVSSRRSTVGDRPFSTLASMELYGEHTHGALLKYACQAVPIEGAQMYGGMDERHTDRETDLCDNLGRALGLVTQMRAVLPLLARQQPIVLLPPPLMTEFELTADIVYGRKNESGMEEMTRMLCQRAHDWVSDARDLSAEISPSVRPLFVHAVIVDQFLARLAKCKYNLLDSRLQNPFGTLIYRMSLKHYFGTPPF